MNTVTFAKVADTLFKPMCNTRAVFYKGITKNEFKIEKITDIRWLPINKQGVVGGVPRTSIRTPMDGNKVRAQLLRIRMALFMSLPFSKFRINICATLNIV